MPTNAVSTPDEIWKILEGTNATLDKTNATLDKTSREMKEFRLSQEESSRKASREIEEIRASQKETGKQLKEAKALFTSQWGQLMESLVEGDLIEILNQWGIAIAHTATRVKQRGRGDDYEYDIIAVNGREVVVVEVKTTLKVSDVKDFLESLGKLTTRMPYHKDKIIYGAVAWLQAHEEAEVYAAKQGLFVIRATGSSARIINRKDFKPQVFS